LALLDKAGIYFLNQLHGKNEDVQRYFVVVLRRKSKWLDGG
jgi:hypothetical protein